MKTALEVAIMAFFAYSLVSASVSVAWVLVDMAMGIVRSVRE